MKHERMSDRHAPELWLRDGTLVPAPYRTINTHRLAGLRVLWCRRMLVRNGTWTLVR